MQATTSTEQLLHDIFDAAQDGLRGEVGPEEYARRQRDFTFHLLDCRNDLERLTGLLQNPDESTEESAAPIVIGCLYHVVPHLKPAARLLLDEVPDAFEPPATSAH
jgi:hypothetical protein